MLIEDNVQVTNEQLIQNCQALLLQLRWILNILKNLCKG